MSNDPKHDIKKGFHQYGSPFFIADIAFKI